MFDFQFFYYGIAILLVLYIVFKMYYESDTISDQDFEYSPIMDQQTLYVTLIHADWCKHCKNIKPWFKQCMIDRTFGNDVKLRMYHQNDTNKYYEHLTHVQGYPTFIFEQGSLRNYHSGALTKSELQGKIKMFPHIK